MGTFKSPLPKRTQPPNPTAYWDNFYATHGADEPHEKLVRDLLTSISLLRESKKYDDVEAALRGFLKHHTKDSETWMYEMLAISVELRKGSKDEVKTLLGYAALKAKMSKNPNQLVSVADKLILREIFDKVGTPGRLTDVGELLDLASEVVPHRSEPIHLSMLAATKSKDPVRMGNAVEKLLSLGWLGTDDQFRREARIQVESLARVLKEESRATEAEALLARLPEIEARDLYIRLTWPAGDDLDLIVEEPLGATACYETPRTVFGGAIVKNGFGKHPEEVYVCPRAFNGDYIVTVKLITDRPVAFANLEIITHEGTSAEKKINRRVALQDGKSKPIIVKLEGGRRKQVMPITANPLAAMLEGLPKSTEKAAKKDAAKSTPAAKPAPAPAPVRTAP